MHVDLRSFSTMGTHEWESFVATNRPSFTSDFFQHAENLIKAAHDNVALQEGETFLLRYLLYFLDKA